MLSGLQSEIDTLFPAIRSLTPSSDEFKLGEDKERFGRVIEISGYKAEIFDMHLAKDRKAYAQRMLDLSRRVQLGRVRLLAHDRQMLTRKDGSVGWFGYLEWMEFSRKDSGSKTDSTGGK